VIAESRAITSGALEAIAVADLHHLFTRYDDLFFEGRIGRRAAELDHPVRFSLSRRMTTAGGKTKFVRQRGDGTVKPGTPIEIALSVVLLAQTFHDVARTIRVNGIECTDRLEAVQRVFEHELVHLIELLVWGQSRCSASRFRALARRIFGHTEVTHDLVTQTERAAIRYDIAVGDAVSFEFDGHLYCGVVNRITKRATVLVEDKRGMLYSNGKRYVKFYVPLSGLSRL
jgi:hypothetical protein